MRLHPRPLPSGLVLLTLGLAAAGAAQEAPAPEPPPIAAMSALAFVPDGTLLVGDARSGAVFAVDLGPRQRRAEAEAVEVSDLEAKLAALVGTRPEDVVVHDLAVDPLTFDVYVAISRNRGKWVLEWNLPNDLGDATELVRIRQDGGLEGVDLAGRRWSRTLLPEPIAPGSEYEWKKGFDRRTEAITDLAWDDGVIWVAGLSNEEFSSAIWRVPYPLTEGGTTITTVENYHVAHEGWETEAPVRSLLPVVLGGRKHLVAAYLCTPLVVFETESLTDGAHVRGRTVAEFGSGNYPLDLVVAPSPAGPRVYLANSNLPLLVFELAELEAFEGALTEPAPGYTAGLAAEYRSWSGLQQLDLLGSHLLALKRTPRGSLDLVSWQLAS